MIYEMSTLHTNNHHHYSFSTLKKKKPPARASPPATEHQSVKVRAAEAARELLRAAANIVLTHAVAVRAAAIITETSTDGGIIVYAVIGFRTIFALAFVHAVELGGCDREWDYVQTLQFGGGKIVSRATLENGTGV